EADALSTLERQRLEACWSAVIGLSLLDPIGAANFVNHNLWLSLKMGDAAHIVRAFAVYSGHAAIDGPVFAPKVERILKHARETAALAPGDYGFGTVALAEGIAAHLQGRWSAAIAGCDRAEEIFRRCRQRDVTWETDTAQTFAMWALMFRGDIT